jgi:hypothetical protein
MILRIVFGMQEQPRPYSGHINTLQSPIHEPKADRRLNILGLNRLKVNGEFHQEHISKSNLTLCK